MSYRKRLFFQKQVYDTGQSDELFFRAIKESVEWHMDRCEEYRKLLEGQGFTIAQLSSYGDLHRIPPIPTLLLKKREMASISQKKIHFKSTTSGTSGRPVTVGFDSSAMLFGANMLRKVLMTHKLISLRPTNYLILGYKPSARNQMGAARTAYSATFLAPGIHKEYALIDMGDGYALNESGILSALTRYEKGRTPVRIYGFPAYLYFLCKRLEEKKIQIHLPSRSMILIGGGWKQFFAQKVDKEELYRMAEKHLGIPKARFHEFFGVVEHNVPYCDCENHHFHVPVYSRVIIRDIQSLKPVPYGTPGILNLMTPLLNSMPLTSILTDDIAVMHEGKKCGCGIEAPYFEILGRAGLYGIKTCAAGAADLLEGIR